MKKSGGGEPAPTEFRIVDAKGIGEHQVWAATHYHPVGELIVVGIGVVESRLPRPADAGC